MAPSWPLFKGISSKSSKQSIGTSQKAPSPLAPSQGLAPRSSQENFTVTTRDSPQPRTCSLEHSNLIEGIEVKDFARTGALLSHSLEPSPAGWPDHYRHSQSSEEQGDRSTLPPNSQILAAENSHSQENKQAISKPTSGIENNRRVDINFKHEQSQGLSDTGNSPKKRKVTFMTDIKDNDNPAYERSVDVSAHGDLTASSVNIFQKYLRPAQSYNVQQDHVFFLLHPEIKRRIYEALFPFANDQIPVTLSPIFATDGVYPKDHFLVPWEILWAIEGGLYACKQFRDELMTFFWTNYNFHVVLSKYTKPVLSRLTMNWLPMYLDRIQYLTIEADFTKLAFGADQNANLLQTGGVNWVKALIKKIVDTILTRRVNFPGTHPPQTIAKLHLKVRRYAGDRPNVDSQKPEPYCPELALFAFDSIMENMQGMVVECRMSGFSRSYTHLFLNHLYGASMKNISPLTPAWPTLPNNLGTPNSSFSSNSWAVLTPQTGSSGPESLPDSPTMTPDVFTQNTMWQAPTSGSTIQYSSTSVPGPSASSTRPGSLMEGSLTISRPPRDSLPQIQWAPDPLPKIRQHPIGLWLQPSNVSSVVRRNTGGSVSTELSEVDFDSDGMVNVESPAASAYGSTFGSPRVQAVSQIAEMSGARKGSTASISSLVSLDLPRADSPTLPNLYRSDSGKTRHGLPTTGRNMETRSMPDDSALPSSRRSGSGIKSSPHSASNPNKTFLPTATSSDMPTAGTLAEKANRYRAHVTQPAKTIAHLGIHKGDMVRIGGFGKTGHLKGFNERTRKYGWVSPNHLTPLDHYSDPVGVIPSFGIPPNNQQVIGIYIAQDDCTPVGYNPRDEMLLKKDDIILIVGKNVQKGRWLGQNETQKTRGWCFGAYLRPHFDPYMYGNNKIMNLHRWECDALQEQSSATLVERNKAQQLPGTSTTESKTAIQVKTEMESTVLSRGYSMGHNNIPNTPDAPEMVMNPRRSSDTPLQAVPSFRRQSSATSQSRLPSAPSPLSNSFTPDKSPRKPKPTLALQSSGPGTSTSNPSKDLGLGISMLPEDRTPQQDQLRSLSSDFGSMGLSGTYASGSSSRRSSANKSFRSPSFDSPSLVSQGSTSSDRIITTTLSAPVGSSGGTLSPHSPNELNRLNEQDPAFRKGLAAFASPDPDANDADGEGETKKKRKGHRGGKKKGKK